MWSIQWRVISAAGTACPPSLGPAAVEAELGVPHEDVPLGFVEREQHGVEAEAARDGRHDRLEQGVERQVALELVGDLKDLVESLGPFPVALGEILKLSTDRPVLEDSAI